MNKLSKENLKVFSEIIEDLANNDIELVEAHYLEAFASDRLDCVNQLVFRSFNETIKTDEQVFNLIKEYEDPCEFASFKVVKIEDIIILYAYI